MIVVGLAILLVAGTASAAISLVKGTEFGRIGIGQDSILVYKIVDDKTTCYVTKVGKYAAHAISCVK